jgi:hypothetical protein
MKDSDPEKWVYREHTRVKNEILEKYLRGWVPILGKYHKRICSDLSRTWFSCLWTVSGPNLDSLARKF